MSPNGISGGSVHLEKVSPHYDRIVAALNDLEGLKVKSIHKK